jgi:hypothetical protein
MTQAEIVQAFYNAIKALKPKPGVVPIMFPTHSVEFAPSKEMSSEEYARLAIEHALSLAHTNMEMVRNFQKANPHADLRPNCIKKPEALADAIPDSSEVPEWWGLTSKTQKGKNKL